MTFPFNLNAFFDEEYLDFEYNELETLVEQEIEALVDEEIEEEMDELNLIELVMLPYENRYGSVTPPHVTTPDCTPLTPLYEEDEDVELATFTDVCLNVVLRPIPTYSQTVQMNKDEESSPSQHQ